MSTQYECWAEHRWLPFHVETREVDDINHAKEAAGVAVCSIGHLPTGSPERSIKGAASDLHTLAEDLIGKIKYVCIKCGHEYSSPPQLSSCRSNTYALSKKKAPEKTTLDSQTASTSNYRRQGTRQGARQVLVLLYCPCAIVRVSKIHCRHEYY
jgi:hypothetical protein